MSEKILYINLFGAFQMTYENEPVVIERNDLTKTNQLFQILLLNKIGGVRKEQLILSLFGNENVADPSNSLRALVFRLRKTMKSFGIEGEIVQIDKGNYSLDLDLTMKLDVVEFCRLIEEGLALENEMDALPLLEEAFLLYRGELLPKLGADEWVVPFRAKYKKIYDDAMKQYLEICNRNKEYQRVLDYSTLASKIYPLEEWQSYAVDALVALGRTTEAIDVYRDTERHIMKELGASVSDRMHQQIQEIGAKVNHQSAEIGQVLSNLDNYKEHTGAFECNYISFAENYQMIRYDGERNARTFWLVMITVTDKKGNALSDTPRCRNLMDEITVAIRKTLRKTDIFTRYSHNQVLLILKQKKESGAQVVFQRICNNLENPEHSKYFQYHVEPIQN